MLYIDNVLLVDVPIYAPKKRVTTVVTHWHADHYAGLSDPERRRRLRVLSPSLEHAVLLMTGLKLAGVDKVVTPARFPLVLERGRVKVYFVRVIHTFEAVNYLVVDKATDMAVLYTADIRAMPSRSIQTIRAVLERENPRSFVVLADSTYFSSGGAKAPPGSVVDINFVAEMSEKRPVVVFVPVTGRWASVLKLLEAIGYTGAVVMAGRGLKIVYNTVMGFKQTRDEAMFYPVRTKVPVMQVTTRSLISMLKRGEPGIYMVSGGMIHTPLAQEVAKLAFENRFPAVVTMTQVKGTPGYDLLTRGKLYRLEHPILHGHMGAREWAVLLSELYDVFPDNFMVMPIHTDREGAARFAEFAKENGFSVPRFDVMRVTGTDIEVVRAKVGRMLVQSGIAPEEPETIRNSGKIALEYVASYAGHVAEPARRALRASRAALTI